MDSLTIWMAVGFLLSAYSVIANDSVQTLGTFIASNSDIHWKWLWIGASLVLVWAIGYGWIVHSGDISYGRLTTIPFQDIQWFHALAPGILLLLTRYGVPVSTTFLVLSAFASSFVLEKMLIKSIIGYGLSAVIAYVLWLGIAKIFDEKNTVPQWQKLWWRVAQWGTTGFLWWTWLSHDMANIAVFLPRAIPLDMLIIVMVIFVAGLAWMFYERGGKIQNIVIEKHSTKYIRSATLIDLVYSLILLYFKGYNSIPMSTTWVFVGLLCGRELAIATIKESHKFKNVFPLVGKDFIKMMIGLGASVAIVLMVHYIFLPLS